MMYQEHPIHLRRDVRVARSTPFPAAPGGSDGFHSAKNEARFPRADRVQELLYLLLETEPAVQAYEPMPDGAVEVRYWAGMVLAAVLPASSSRRAAAIALKRAHARAGRRLVLVPERRLNRSTTRENRRTIADCGHALLRPAERVVVVEALLEQNGSAELGAVARLLSGSADPVAAVLSLVAEGILRVAMDGPIDGRTKVSLFDPFAFAR